MPHSAQEKQRALVRLRRIKGQVEGLERALQAGADCAAVIQQIAAVRGAVHGLMQQVLEAHLREGFAVAATAEAREAQAAELLQLLRRALN